MGQEVVRQGLAALLDYARCLGGRQRGRFPQAWPSPLCGRTVRPALSRWSHTPSRALRSLLGGKRTARRRWLAGGGVQVNRSLRPYLLGRHFIT